MAVDPSLYYRTISDADDYFTDQLYATDWSGAATADKDKALLMATQAVDSLKFKGVKKSLYDALVTAGGTAGEPGEVLLAATTLTDAEIKAANDLQALQFPRDQETADTVPDDVFYAVCEEAKELLAGRDPDQEFRNLVLTSDGVGSNRVSSDRSQMPPEHSSHFFTSPKAFKYLKRYLTPANSFNIRRV